MNGSADPTDDLLSSIAQQLSDVGYCIIENALPDEISQGLYQRVSSLSADEFKRAGIGRSQQHQLDDDYRRDTIHWLENESVAETAYLEWMEQLRLSINQQLFMGLFDYESHFSHYAPGTFYKRHLDAFQGKSNRVVTTVFYLNDDWQASSGGKILIYADQQSEQPFKRVLPQMGTLVVFLSDQFPHEVLAAQRDRYSIAGWFRIKALGGVIDPPR